MDHGFDSSVGLKMECGFAQRFHPTCDSVEQGPTEQRKCGTAEHRKGKDCL